MNNVLFENFKSDNQFDLLRNEGLRKAQGPHEIEFIFFFGWLWKNYFFWYCFGQHRKTGECGGCALHFAPRGKINHFICFWFQADRAKFCFSLVFIVITWTWISFVSFLRDNTNNMKKILARPRSHTRQKCGRFLTIFFHFSKLLVVVLGLVSIKELVRVEDAPSNRFACYGIKINILTCLWF